MAELSPVAISHRGFCIRGTDVRSGLNIEQFIALWNKCDSVAEFCKMSGMKYGTAVSRASSYRRSTYHIKKMPGYGGFAAMSEEKRKEVASQGGKQAQENGTAHKFSADEAVEAGKRSWKGVRKKGKKNASKADSGSSSDKATEGSGQE